ncbi:hypothetical protein [Shewanella sp.]|uniref:hypothetical protein n=1 Tax=Shewanella sp. TaxID=50422 RepID=UPI0040486FE6
MNLDRLFESLEVVGVTTFKERHRCMNAQAKKYGLNLEYIWSFDFDALTDLDLGRIKKFVTEHEYFCYPNHQR